MSDVRCLMSVCPPGVTFIEYQVKDVLSLIARQVTTQEVCLEAIPARPSLVTQPIQTIKL